MAQWVAACQTSDIDPEDVIPFDHAGRAYAIYRSPGDRYYATDGHCTHEQTLLCDGLVMDDVIECPMHNGRFDYTTGRALGAPVLTDLRCYPVRVENQYRSGWSGAETLVSRFRSIDRRIHGSVTVSVPGPIWQRNPAAMTPTTSAPTAPAPACL